MVVIHSDKVMKDNNTSQINNHLPENFLKAVKELLVPLSG